MLETIQTRESVCYITARSVVVAKDGAESKDSVIRFIDLSRIAGGRAKPWNVFHIVRC